mmetsp:Transcript_21752/g.52594  ORF Transcript_21752/g.52594 Transcript_21752/m.52594 type:complete len:641 (-) Transcript_21752:438-2360(-)
MMDTASSSLPGISPADLTLGQLVQIESRTWAGINKPGGRARVAKIHLDADGVPAGVDVAYVMGGREAGVELTYVRNPPSELERGGRSRRSDAKMNLAVLGSSAATENKRKKKNGRAAAAKKKKGGDREDKGGNKKRRKALANIDGNNNGEAGQAAKKIREDDGKTPSPKNNAADAIETAAEDAADGTWTLIQDGRTADYADVLTTGRRISYWWSQEDGWLPGCVTKSLHKIVTPQTIRWSVGIDFDNGDQHAALGFHPLEKRWKVLGVVDGRPSSSSGPAAAKAEPGEHESAPQAKESSPKKKRKKKKKSTEPKTSKSSESAGSKAKAAKEKAAARSFSASKPKVDGPTYTNAHTHARTHTQERPSFSFGARLQSKIKEAASKMRAAADGAPAAEGLVSYSPNSILAVRAAHARTPAKAPAGSSTRSIGFSSPLPPGTLSTNDAEGCAARYPPSATAPSTVASASRAAPTAKDASAVSSRGDGEAMHSRASAEYARSIRLSSGGDGGPTVMQSLYRRERERADDFVDYMTKPSGKDGEERGCAAREPSSPEGSEDGDLELTLDQGRMRLFNSILVEILFRTSKDYMEVEEMIEKMNSTRAILSLRPFTLLEIRPYIRKLEEASRIMLVEDQGKMGAIFVI